jgi:hypothetical protein
LIGGRNLDAAQIRGLRSCLLGQTAVAESVQRDGRAAGETQNGEVAAVVVASFRNQSFCLSFNDDGTISGDGSLIVTSGGYVGTPGSFTLFSYSGIALVGTSRAPVNSFGLTIGPVSIEFVSGAGVLVGLQVPSC